MSADDEQKRGSESRRPVATVAIDNFHIPLLEKVLKDPLEWGSFNNIIKYAAVNGNCEAVEVVCKAYMEKPDARADWRGPRFIEAAEHAMSARHHVMSARELIDHRLSSTTLAIIRTLYESEYAFSIAGGRATYEDSRLCAAISALTTRASTTPDNPAACQIVELIHSLQDASFAKKLADA